MGPRRPAAAADRPGCDHDGGDSGVATVGAAIGLAVLVVAVLLGLYLGSAVVARHRAAAAADLAALAAATESVLGHDRACARAAHIAGAMGAELTGCALDGWDVRVQVRVPIGLPLPAGGPTLAVARAAAGPVTDLPAAARAPPGDFFRGAGRGRWSAGTHGAPGRARVDRGYSSGRITQPLRRSTRTPRPDPPTAQ